MLQIELVELDQLDEYMEHMVALQHESGENGEPVFTPLPASAENFASMRERRNDGWGTPVTDVGWVRSWAVRENGTVAGDIEFHGGSLYSELHRATLGMGLLRPYRGRGLGRELLDVAIEWAREQSSLDWIDLGVFSGNPRAVRLYEAAGFSRIGLRVDAFRINGEPVDDILMTLGVGD